MKYIRGFDGIRAISLLMVLLDHLGVFDKACSNPYFNTRIYPLFSGNTGVTIFFVLSGFLITRMLCAEKYSSGKISLKNFYARRFLRLAPALFIFYAVIAVLMLAGAIYRTFKGFMLSFFYLYNFAFHDYYTMELGHTWSLAVEEQFYLLWPLILCYSTWRRWLFFAITLILVCAASWYVPGFSVGNFWQGHTLQSLYFFEHGFIPAAAPIMVGCIAAILSFYHTTLKEAAITASKTAVAIIYIFLFSASVWLPLPMLPVCYILQATAVALLLVWLFFNQTSLLCKLLEKKPLAYLGKISYGLYVYQGLFLTTGPGGKLFIQQFPQNIILTVVCAIISYEFLEKSVLRYKRKFS